MRSLHVLLVEDSPADGEVLTALLDGMGHAGPQAQQTVQAVPPTVLTRLGNAAGVR